MKGNQIKNHGFPIQKGLIQNSDSTISEHYNIQAKIDLFWNILNSVGVVLTAVIMAGFAILFIY